MNQKDVHKCNQGTFLRYSDDGDLGLILKVNRVAEMYFIYWFNDREAITYTGTFLREQCELIELDS